MTKPIQKSDRPNRLMQPLSELMRLTRQEIDGVASGACTMDGQRVEQLAKRMRTMEEMVTEQDRQAAPQLTAIDWLGRAELQVQDLRRRIAKGDLSGDAVHALLEATIGMLVAARAAVGSDVDPRGRRQ
ncbi:hypothetical protein [Fulvimarina endophytica]|uniref:hypothetical protein n=1 Tax=Fulvimarina endophytica TaxID=2293836 RepID=UPI001FDEFA71|nr:hypothetical protein [Fulvimarina endophytica]